MTTKTTAPPASGADFTQCPLWGQGGQYTADPVSGMRTRVDTLPLPDAPGINAAPAADTFAAKGKK